MEIADCLLKETIIALDSKPTNKRTSNPTPEILCDQKESDYL
jgi:hypothetical protein